MAKRQFAWFAWIAWLPAASAQEPLRYKFKPNQKLTYQVAIVAKVFGADGKTVAADAKQIFDIALAVKDVRPDGSASMLRKLTRVRIQLQLPDRNVEYDSDNPQGGEAALGELVAKSIERIVRGEMTQRMSSTGKLEDFQLSIDLAMLQRENPQLVLSGLGEANLKNVASMTALELPSGPLPVGTTWKKSEEMPQPQFTQTTTTEFTYKGPVDRGGKQLEHIVAKPSIAVAVKPDAQAEVQVKSQQHSGEAFFDRDLGQLVGLETNSRIVISFKSGDQNGEQNVAYQNTVKLLKAE